MAPPSSNAKRSRKNSSSSSSLRRSQWKGKLGRKRGPIANPNSARQKPRSGKASRTHDRTAYHPPRLQDLQFQNRLKAFSHFPDRREAVAVGAAAYASLLDGPIASGTGFPVPSFNASRGLLPDANVGGLPLDFPMQGPAYPGSLLYPGKSPNFAVPNPRLLNYQGQSVFFPGSMLYTGAHEAILNPLVSNPAGTFLIGANEAADASSSGTATFRKHYVKGNIPSKRHKAYRRPQRVLTGSRKQLNSAPAAPRNTTSFLMRAKKSGGIASFVSPSPVTPAVLPTPVPSPFVHLPGLGHEANHEWGVDDYGSMNGLIRLRSLDLGTLEYGDNNDSESDVEQGAHSVQQLEQRMDHDLSRFVMTYPAGRRQDMGQDSMDIQRIDDQDSHIAHLEEENMDLRERLYSVQQEVDDLRRRLRALEGISSSDEAEAEASPARSAANISCL